MVVIDNGIDFVFNNNMGLGRNSQSLREDIIIDFCVAALKNGPASYELAIQISRSIFEITEGNTPYEDSQTNSSSPEASPTPDSQSPEQYPHDDATHQTDQQ